MNLINFSRISSEATQWENSCLPTLGDAVNRQAACTTGVNKMGKSFIAAKKAENRSIKPV